MYCNQVWTFVMISKERNPKFDNNYLLNSIQLIFNICLLFFPIMFGWDYIQIIFNFSVKECSAHIVHIWQFYVADPYDWKRPLVQSFNGKDLRTDFENCILSGRILCLFNDSMRRQKNIHCEILQRNYNVPVLELLFLFKMVFKIRFIQGQLKIVPL